MSAAVKKRITLVPDSATQDLWRAAEGGDLEELNRVLMRVSDVNARNKYGMTALMKAAYYGHEEIVRALLDHGADPNLTRNDKFTALALAAFFGHTQTVRTLLDHGARAEVVTRCGASASVWARARTFAEAAEYLELKTPVAVVAPAPLPAPAPARASASAPVPPLVVKTLKDPPEIWDLVHEVRPSFNARTAFIGRVKSMNRFLAIGFMAILPGVVGAGVLLFRGAPARNLPAIEIPVNPTVKTSAPQEPQTVEASISVSEPEPTVIESSHPARVTPKVRARSYVRDNVVETVQTKEEAPPAAAAPVAAIPKIAPPETSLKRPANPLSPQLIAPTKTDGPKAKVIQWP